MKTHPVLLFVLYSTLSAPAQSTNSFPLWPDGTPGALGKEAKDIPTLTVFLPPAEKASGAALVIYTGGAYGHLADVEGSHYALLTV